MQNNSNPLGSVLKSARLGKRLTRKELAMQLGITPRYVTSLENGEKKPSYALLDRIVQELTISADMIFYPESNHEYSEVEKLRLLLKSYDEKEVNAIITALQTLLSSKHRSVK